MTKIKAFTLIELLVALVIVSVVIGIAYSGFRIFSNSLINLKKSNSKTLELSTLNKLLVTEFFKSNKIIKHEDKLIFYFSGNRKVMYKLEDNFIIREQIGIYDTFQTPVNNLEIKYLNKKELEKNLVESLRFESHCNSEIHSLYFEKKYAVDIIANQDVIEDVRN